MHDLCLARTRTSKFWLSAPQEGRQSIQRSTVQTSAPLRVAPATRLELDADQRRSISKPLVLVPPLPEPRSKSQRSAAVRQ